MLIYHNAFGTGVINGNQQVCSGSISTYFIDPVVNATNYSWTLPNGCSGSSTNESIDLLIGIESGVLLLDVTVSGGTILNYSTTISVELMPVALFSPKYSTCTSVNPDIYFQNESLNAVSYKWYFGNGDSSNNESLVYLYETYVGEFFVTLIAFSNFGCSDTIVHSVEVNYDFHLYIPNSFSPDGDNYNETFNPILNSSVQFDSYELIVGNRAEGVLYESRDPYIGWNGKYKNEDVSSGVYPWIINYKTKFSDEVQTIYGHVNLLK